MDILNGKGWGLLGGGGGVLKTKILKGKSMNQNWNFPMKGKIGGKPFVSVIDVCKDITAKPGSSLLFPLGNLSVSPTRAISPVLGELWGKGLV